MYQGHAHAGVGLTTDEPDRRDVQRDDDQGVTLTGSKVDDIGVTRLFLSASWRFRPRFASGPYLQVLNLRRLEHQHGRCQRGVDEDDTTTSVVLVSLVVFTTRGSSCLPTSCCSAWAWARARLLNTQPVAAHHNGIVSVKIARSLVVKTTLFSRQACPPKALFAL